MPKEHIMYLIYSNNMLEYATHITEPFNLDKWLEDIKHGYKVTNFKVHFISREKIVVTYNHMGFKIKHILEIYFNKNVDGMHRLDVADYLDEDSYNDWSEEHD